MQTTEELTEEQLAAKREKNRIKVAKYRARKRAREEGLDPDTYIDGAQGEEEQWEGEGIPLWVLGVGVLIIGALIVVAIAQNRARDRGEEEQE
jgi:hypothetical protein